MPLSIAIDTGGTFTDLAAVKEDGTAYRIKVPSTPHDPSAAILDALNALKKDQPELVVEQILHGTTVATNAILEGRGGRTILVTNEGFEDVLALRRQNRTDLYALHPTVPCALIPRSQIIGISVRRGPQGEVITPLEPLVHWISRHTHIFEGAESVAISLLHAYRMGDDEARIADSLRTRFPHLAITTSHQLSPTFREYERTSTCAANARLLPLVSRYMNALSQRLAMLGGISRQRGVLVMGSAGGLMTASKAANEPIHTVLSGPAGGVRGAWQVGLRCKRRTLLTLDMGGTSTDVSIIVGDLEPEPRAEIAGHALSIPVLPIETVGAGGGSIAYVDEGGALRVGPLSAGAQPGPACYGRGGQAATVTDAHVVLGRIERLLGGQFKLHRQHAQDALQRLADGLDADVTETAEAVIRIAEAHMTRACKRVTRERGIDPRDTSLVAFGGAGGLHACRIAEELGCADVIFPREPGLLSAEGIAVAPREVHGTRTIFLVEGHWEQAELAEHYQKLQSSLISRLGSNGDLTALIDCRYEGQTFTLPVSAPQAPASRELRQLFDEAHRLRYGYALGPETAIELVALRMYLRISPQRPQGDLSASTGKNFDGPTTIATYSATLFVPEGWNAK